MMRLLNKVTEFRHLDDTAHGSNTQSKQKLTMKKSSRSHLSRREALRILSGGAAAAAVGPVVLHAEDGTPPATPPNVLFVFSDQQQNRTWEKNHPLIKTPRMMQLAAQGTVVQNMIS